MLCGKKRYQRIWSGKFIAWEGIKDYDRILKIKLIVPDK